MKIKVVASLVLFIFTTNLESNNLSSIEFENNLSGAGIKIKITINAWGWWTGHYCHMNDFSVATSGSNFKDDFNDGVISDDWNISGNFVKESDGIIAIATNQTDKGGVLISRWFSVSPNGKLVIERKIKLHYGNNKFLGTMRLSVAENESKGFGVYYGNMNYSTNEFSSVDGIHIFREGANAHLKKDQKNISQMIKCPWDKWYKEKLVYNFTTGKADYYIDNQLMLSYSVGKISETLITKAPMDRKAFPNISDINYQTNQKSKKNLNNGNHKLLKLSKYTEEDLPSQSVLNLIEPLQKQQYDKKYKTYNVIQLKLIGSQIENILSSKNYIYEYSELVKGLYLLIVQPFEQIIKIVRKDYVDLEIPLVYKNNEIEKSFTIEDENQKSAICFITEPPGAELLISESNQLIGNERDIIYFQTPIKETIKVKKEDYENAMINVDVSLGYCQFEIVKMVSNFAYLKINTPEKMDISIDGQKFNSKSIIKLKEGNHNLSIINDKYMSFDTTLTLQRDSTYVLNPNLFEKSVIYGDQIKFRVGDQSIYKLVTTGPNDYYKERIIESEITDSVLINRYKYFKVTSYADYYFRISSEGIYFTYGIEENFKESMLLPLPLKISTSWNINNDLENTSHNVIGLIDFSVGKKKLSDCFKVYFSGRINGLEVSGYYIFDRFLGVVYQETFSGVYKSVLELMLD
jgi:hypothetical protein